MLRAGTRGGNSDAPANERRERLIRQIVAEMDSIGGWYHRRSLDARVLEAIANVPREEFVPAGEEAYAYADIALPIGYSQTISQPFVVAVMTDLLRPQPDDVILEVGTGSGYQAAVLAQLVRQVYSIEVIEPLASAARARLARLGCNNVEVRHGDGYDGWPEHAPYDGVIVTAAAPSIPPPLLDQTKPGGHLVIPVDSESGAQDLMVLEKTAAGEVLSHNVFPVAFVPLTRSAKR